MWKKFRFLAYVCTFFLGGNDLCGLGAVVYSFINYVGARVILRNLAKKEHYVQLDNTRCNVQIAGG